ncbi:hypothetical protein ABFS83_12G174600 [Erythranthe nasuta]
METKRNKLLWELISTRMKDKGHNRNPLICSGSASGKTSSPAISSKKKGVVHHQFSSDEDDDLENDDISIQGEKRKRKMVMKGRTGELGNSIVNGVREMMEDFMKHEMEVVKM